MLHVVIRLFFFICKLIIYLFSFFFFIVASSHSLDVLSDVLGDFLKRFCCVLKENSEDVHRRPPEDQGSLDVS